MTNIGCKQIQIFSLMFSMKGHLLDFDDAAAKQQDSWYRSLSDASCARHEASQRAGRLAAVDLIALLAPLDRSRGRRQLCDVAQQR